VPRTESMQIRLGILREGSATMSCAPQTENRLLKTVSGLHLLPQILIRASPRISPEEGVLRCLPCSVIAIYPHRGLLLFLGVVGICV
jgi:hypothetical protein